MIDIQKLKKKYVNKVGTNFYGLIKTYGDKVHTNFYG